MTERVNDRAGSAVQYRASDARQSGKPDKPDKPDKIDKFRPSSTQGGLRPCEPAQDFSPVFESSGRAWNAEIKDGSMARRDGRVWEKEEHYLIHLRRYGGTLINMGA